MSKLITDSSERTSLQNAIELFKLESVANSITPHRAGTLLERIIGLSKNEIDELQDFIDKMSKDPIQYVGLIDLNELDDMDFNSATKHYLELGSKPCRLLVKTKVSTTSGADLFSIVGTLDIIGDNMQHQLTQIFTTHYILDGDKSFKSGAHTDGRINQYFRSFGIAGAPRGEWTEWKELYPLASPSDNGLMSAQDKKRLDGMKNIIVLTEEELEEIENADQVDENSIYMIY